MLILKPLCKKGLYAYVVYEYTGNHSTRAVIENPNYNLKSIEKNRQTNVPVGLKTYGWAILAVIK